MNAEVRAKLQAKFGGSVRTGGKGTVRRKKKAFRKSAGQDDKRLQMTLKKLNVNPIPAIEEVNMFMEDGNVVHFESPKVQAAIAANTYVVSGNAQTKKLEQLLPDIINQLGQNDLANLRHIAETYGNTGAADDDDDDDVPDLVENFDQAAVNDDDDDVPELVE